MSDLNAQLFVFFVVLFLIEYLLVSINNFSVLASTALLFMSVTEITVRNRWRRG
jgi:hypothetical protein